MRALWLEEKTLSVREDVPIPKPDSGEALIRVRFAGICGTDLEMLQGYITTLLVFQDLNLWGRLLKHQPVVT